MYQSKESTRGNMPPSTGSCVKHDREIKVVISVDTSALDAALEKAQRLLDLMNDVNKGAMRNA